MNKSENFSDRLKGWRVRVDFRQDEAAELLGIGRSYYNQLEKDARKPGDFLVQKFEMIEHESPAAARVRLGETVNRFKRSPDGSDGSDGNGHVTSLRETPARYAGSILRRVPLVGWAQAMDAINLVDFSDVVHWDEFEPTDCRDPKAIAVVIRGDSMQPEYSDGDIAILACSSEPMTGDLVVGRLKKEGAVFKLFQIIDMERGLYRLSSFNPHYAPIDRAASDFLWIYPVYSVTKKLMKR